MPRAAAAGVTSRRRRRSSSPIAAAAVVRVVMPIAYLPRQFDIACRGVVVLSRLPIFAPRLAPI